jgi:hypothetical protein
MHSLTVIIDRFGGFRLSFPLGFRSEHSAAREAGEKQQQGKPSRDASGMIHLLDS